MWVSRFQACSVVIYLYYLKFCNSFLIWNACLLQSISKIDAYRIPKSLLFSKPSQVGRLITIMFSPEYSSYSGPGLFCASLSNLVHFWWPEVSLFGVYAIVAWYYHRNEVWRILEHQESEKINSNFLLLDVTTIFAQLVICNQEIGLPMISTKFQIAALQHRRCSTRSLSQESNRFCGTSQSFGIGVLMP